MLSTVAARSIPICKRRGALLLALAIGLTGLGPLVVTRAAGLDEQQPIKVAAVTGSVHVSMRGQARSVVIGETIELPASIDTGPDGSIELREGGTLIAVAANSSIRIPIPSQPGERLDRVIQAKGNAFYSVARRVISHLRVETPYLVAVVKGTQFSVSSLSDRTTIALFEGQLEVDAADHSDTVELNAGEIAIRSGLGRIRVLRMSTGQTLRASIGAGGVAIPAAGVATRAGTLQVGGSSATVAGSSLATGGSALPAGNLTGTGTLGTSATASVAPTALSPSGSLAATSGLSTSVNVETAGTGLSTNVGVGASLGTSTGVTASAGLGASAGVGTTGVSATAGLGANAGVGTTGVSATAGLGTNVGVASSAVSAGLSTGVNASLGTTGTTGSTGLSVGASTSATAGVGTTTAGVSAGASVNAGTSTGVSVGVGTSVSVAGTTVGASTSVSTGSLLGSRPGTSSSGSIGSLLNGITSKLRRP